MALDITLSPLYRINGQETAKMPGLIALTPPRNAARGREQDRLVVYLLLTGNSVFTTTEYMKVAEDASKVFYATSGSLTNALRTATESVNKVLLERNMESSSRGQYAVGWLTIAAMRDMQITFLLSGPMHAYHFSQSESRHVFEPNVSGKGLGMSQTASIHYAQATLQMGDRLLFCGKVPNAWENTLKDPILSSLDAMRRRLVTLTSEDLNAVLMQVSNGVGAVNLFSGATEQKEEKVDATIPPPASTVNLPRREEPSPAPVENPTTFIPEAQPSAYSIPAAIEEPIKKNPDPISSLPRGNTPRNFPSSIPRADSYKPDVPSVVETANVVLPPTQIDRIVEETKIDVPPAPREPSPGARRAAKTLASGIQATRKLSISFGERLKNFLPRLLPDADSPVPSASPSNFAMFMIAIVIPLIVVVMAFVVYLKYGRSQQYDAYLAQAQESRAQAVTLTNPLEQRVAWEKVFFNVTSAEAHRKTTDTDNLRKEAEANLDALHGITRLQFNPAFSSSVGIHISRMAASESDLFLLNAETGEVLRAQLTNGLGFQLDTAFNCRPGVYGNYTVGPLVDILAMPTLNSINATLLGVDATGNLLYCAPGQVAQAIPLPTPDTNWGRVTAFVLDGGNLYVLDSPSRAVWVYNGKDGTFIDRPYFFFSQQTPTQDVIDLVVTGDELYMLHSDGHISNCSYSRIQAKPSQCQDPFPMVNPFSAYPDAEMFGASHFTQMLFAAPPDQSILLLDADAQSVMRFTPRSLELQNQFKPTTDSKNPIPSGSIDAVAVGPNHIMYFAVDGQVYFATMP